MVTFWVIKAKLVQLMKKDSRLLDEKTMDEIDLMHLENIFILLRNEGKDLATIKNKMKRISPDLIDEWNRGYENEINRIDSSTPVETHITSKSKSGNYSYQNSISFRVSQLDKILMDLREFLSIDIARVKSEEVDDAKIFFRNCKQSLESIEKFVADIQIKNERGNNNVEVKYELKENSSEAKAKVDEAVKFYLYGVRLPQLEREASTLIQNVSSYCYDVATNIMPIALKTFKAKNYYSIKELSLSEIPVDAKWIFITGENGFGKTVLLQALTASFFGHKDQDRILIDIDTDIAASVEYKSGNNSFINHLKENRSPLKNIVCYGPSRLTTTSRFTSEDDERLLSPTNSLFNPQSPLLSIENDLIIWKLDNPERFELIKKLFKNVIPYLDDITVSKDKKRILYTEKQPGSKSKYEPVSFTKLASGFKSLIAMVGDMILRFYNYQPDVQDPRHFEGIVLIDELDLHAHPKLQMQLPKLLSEAFPKVQFIASTHSAIPLLGAPEQSVVIKVTRNKKDGIKAEKLDVDLKKLTPNLILTSPIFDMETLSSVNTKDLRDVRTEDTYQEMKENDEVDKILDDYQKTDQKYPDHLFQ